ncbi:hypothetical protein MIB92_05250 [Aestuariirhabdus sp. Z084]|uniref:hypothetical protein n=1 Tax=Aestuariirhabdus haliotis TaxID=2918751 RepID=UPI00201B3AD2|nr:hypothetical protein [Aestuariirhabdus haliotis]MCL6415047.1 hypothetical protein [Aestuariirhabdus haliotis]MCL6418979.1 hypothetical protein [Aestuariirhabdus haliotis]
MREHGSYSIRITGRVIECDCYGSWNDETAQRYCREQRAIVRQLGADSWAKILDLSEWELGTPSIQLPLNELYVWNALHGQTRQINIRHHSLFKDMHLKNIIPDNTSIIITEMKNWSEARDLLCSEGFLTARERSSLE